MTSKLTISRRCLIWATIIGAMSSGLLVRVVAQDADVLKSRILTAIRQSSLVSPTTPSFQLEGKVTVFDGAGKNPQEGTVRILRLGKTSRVSIVFPGSNTDVLTTPAGTYVGGQGTLPFQAAPIVVNLERPIGFKGFDASAEIRPRNLGSDATLDCAELISSQQEIVRGPVTSQHAVCLDPVTSDLRIVIDGFNEFHRDDVVTLGDQRIARKVRLHLAGVTVAEIDVHRLEVADPKDSDLAVSPEMKLVKDQPARIPGAVIAGKILTHENPKYPGSARAAHIQGIVVLHALIDKNGHISDLSVISSPDKSLSEASLKAVQKWTYQPYVLNGEPVEIDTTISVNFALGQQ